MTRRTFRAACHVRSSPATARATRLDFDCEPGRVERGPGVRVQGHVVWSEDAGAAGSIDSLELPGQAPLRDLDIAARGPVSPTPQRGAAFTLRRGRLHARGSDGNALESLDLRWNGGEGTSVLTVVDDFAPVRIAIAAMARDGEEGRFDGFGNAPFRRGRLMPSLWSGLGAVPGAWCCLDTAGLPPALATPIGVSSVPAPGHTAFHQYCGQCHQSVLPAPPNFLDGDAETIEAKLRQCAPRMYVRLAMWRSVSQVRAKTPMPPEVALRRFHLAEDAWRDGDALAGLLQSVGERIRAETGTGPQLESLLRDGYENLRPCLPAQTR
jgi:mono/diheme cytochrome c family protein